MGIEAKLTNSKKCFGFLAGHLIFSAVNYKLQESSQVEEDDRADKVGESIAKLFAEFGSLPGPATPESDDELIAGKVKVAAPATLWYNILPACVSTVKEVAPAAIDTEFPVPTP